MKKTNLNWSFYNQKMKALSRATGKDTRPLSTIARDIRKDWKSVYFGAKPYLEAMASLTDISDSFGMDSARSIVFYFLPNAQTWKGETARAIKKELKALTKSKR
jgi:hypothetical protein